MASVPSSDVLLRRARSAAIWFHNSIRQWIAERNTEFQDIDTDALKLQSESGGRFQVRVTG